MTRFHRTLAFSVALLAVACGGAKDGSDTASAGGAVASEAPAVDPTGKVIKVDMVTDEKGNYYAPSVIDAARGDVVRFILKTGVHNVNFPADSNPGKSNLPKVSDYLQLPGQEYDLLVSLAPGSYYFHCDPHALLGMTGTLNVK